MCLWEMNMALGSPVEGIEHNLSKLNQEVDFNLSHTVWYVRLYIFENYFCVVFIVRYSQINIHFRMLEE